MTRLTALCIVALVSAGCLTKPARPGDDGDIDGGGGGDTDARVGCGGPPGSTPTAWDPDDVIRFNQRQGLIDPDCREDLVIPGLLAADDEEGIFVVLGRDEDFLDGGYDGFVPTAPHIPVDLSLTKLVGDDDALDLVVVATDDVGDKTFVDVYQGDGHGGFTPFAANETSEALIVGGGVDFPTPSYVFPAQLHAAGGPVSLVFGDAEHMHVLSPASWTEEDILSASAVVPDGIEDQSQTQEVVAVPSASGGQDLFQVAQNDTRWWANAGDGTFGNVDVNSDFSGVGPLAVDDADGDGDNDAVWSRQGQDLGFFELEESATSGAPGVTSTWGFNEPATGIPFTPSNGSFSDVTMLDVNGNGTSDLLLVNAEALDAGDNNKTRVWLFVDLFVDGEVTAVAGESYDVAAPATFPKPNRMFIGNYHEDQQRIYVVSSQPGLPGAGVLCYLPVKGAGPVLDPCD